MNVVPEASTSRRARRLRRWSASGRMTPLLIGILCISLALVSYWHFRGQFHVIKEKVGVVDTPDDVPHTNGPGGQDAVVLTRAKDDSTDGPQFLSATLLPGRGFNLWQLTADIPGHGTVPLLVSPSVADARTLLAGTGTDANGSGSTSFGGAFLAPFAAPVTGSPATGTGSLQTQWQSQSLGFPSASLGSLFSTEGLILARGADSVKLSKTQASTSATAVFHAGTFGGGWPSLTDMSITVDMSGNSLELTMTARNIGTDVEPFALGWHPYFAIPFGDRSDASLVIPSNDHIVTDPHTGQPSGAIDSSDSAPNTFDRANGTRLGDLSLDATYLDLNSSILADGPIAELRVPAGGYGIRVIPLTTNIKTLHVVAPSDKNWVSIMPNMNVPDPLGHEWDKLNTTGMVLLQPGDSVVWKVRVELFPLH